MTTLNPTMPVALRGAPERVYPSRLPRDLPPLGPDGGSATRWTDPSLARTYAQRDDEAERRLLWPLLADAVRPTIPKHVPGRPDGTVLELGCGLGALAQHLADRHWLRVYAFDISPTMHRLGAGRFRDAWVSRTLPDSRGRIPLRRAQCTAALAQRLLLHLAHPCLITGLLSDARRVLRTGAVLAVAERDTRERPGAAEEPEEPRLTYPRQAAAFVERYRLRNGTALETTGWWHCPETIACCLRAAGFALEAILQVPGPEPLLLYRARAVCLPVGPGCAS
jgi:SAM-dependent methyltransferase